MTVKTIKQILSALPDNVSVRFYNHAGYFNIDKIECAQVSNDDPLEVVLSGELL